MSDFKKVGGTNPKQKRRNESQNLRIEDLELRNYLTKKLKNNQGESLPTISTSTTSDAPTKSPSSSIHVIKITTNGKTSIKNYVTQAIQRLQSKYPQQPQATSSESTNIAQTQPESITIALEAKDKSISRLVTVVEIVKQELGKANIIQNNTIFNVKDADCSQKACMRTELSYSATATSAPKTQ